MGLLDFAQGASNAAASTVSAPVDGIAWLLRRAGVPIPEAPIGGSEWMARQGLTREPKDRVSGLLGEAAGMAVPMVAAAKAPQIARGLLQLEQNAAAPAKLGKQRGVMSMGGDDYKGVKIDGEYMAGHRPMTVEQGASSLHDLEGAFGPDIYSPKALQYFGSGDQREAEIIRQLRMVRGKPDAQVTIYRGVPDGVTGINPGDWVTLSPSVAADYGNVVSMKVPASHITSWPDSLIEFGYYPKGK